MACEVHAKYLRTVNRVEETSKQCRGDRDVLIQLVSSAVREADNRCPANDVTRPP